MSDNTTYTAASLEALTLSQIRAIIDSRYGEEGGVGVEFFALVALERMREALAQGWAWHYRLPSGAGYGLSATDRAAWAEAHSDSYAAALAWCASRVTAGLAR